MNRRAGERSPRVLIMLGALGALIFILPLVGLAFETPWGSLGALITDETVVDALRVSLISSGLAAAISVVLGVPLAWILARVERPGIGVLRSVVTLPMVLPPVVGGAALLFALGRRGLVGEPLNEATGLLLPFSIWGVVLANVFVAMPFLVVTVEGAIRSVDTEFESAAASLGASPLQVFRRVTLPSISPSLRAGIVLAWARALGEFGATVTFAGNLQGRTQTLPLAVFVALESDRDAAVAISLVLVVISLVLLLSMRNRWWGRP